MLIDYAVCDYNEMLCRYVPMCMKSLFHILFSQKQFCQLFLCSDYHSESFRTDVSAFDTNFIDNSQH